MLDSCLDFFGDHFILTLCFALFFMYAALQPTSKEDIEAYQNQVTISGVVTYAYNSYDDDGKFHSSDVTISYNVANEDYSFSAKIYQPKNVGDAITIYYDKRDGATGRLDSTLSLTTITVIKVFCFILASLIFLVYIVLIVRYSSTSGKLLYWSKISSRFKKSFYQKVEADYTGIEEVRLGKNKWGYRLVCQWCDNKVEKNYTFKTKPLKFNAAKHYRVGDKVIVWHNGDYTKYRVELNPTLAKKFW